MIYSEYVIAILLFVSLLLIEHTALLLISKGEGMSLLFQRSIISQTLIRIRNGLTGSLTIKELIVTTLFDLVLIIGSINIFLKFIQNHLPETYITLFGLLLLVRIAMGIVTIKTFLNGVEYRTYTEFIANNIVLSIGIIALYFHIEMKTSSLIGPMLLISALVVLAIIMRQFSVQNEKTITGRRINNISRMRIYTDIIDVLILCTYIRTLLFEIIFYSKSLQILSLIVFSSLIFIMSKVVTVVIKDISQQFVLKSSIILILSGICLKVINL